MGMLFRSTLLSTKWYHGWWWTWTTAGCWINEWV